MGMSDWRDVEVSLHRSRGGLGEGVYVEQFDSLKVCVGSCMACGEGSSFEFNLRRVVDAVDFSGFVGEPEEAFSLLAINEVPLNPPNLVESLLTGTVEGQQLLEFVVAEYTSWGVPLDVSRLSRESEAEDVVWFSDFEYQECITSGEDGQYEVASEFEQRMEGASPFSDFFGVPCDEQVSYVLRLRDEKWRDWFYVGESSNVLSRMDTHMKNGGDFSTRACDCDVRIVEVECVRSDISERGLYEEVVSEYEVPEERVLGGM